MLETVIYQKDGPIAWIRLNRPEALNTISWKLSHEVVDVIEEISYDDSIRAVILTGMGRAFCAGADIKEATTPGALSLKTLMGDGEVLEVFQKIDDLQKPIIAAVNGASIGGGTEMAMACDLRIAADNAKFGFGEVKIGTIPGGGGTMRLPLLVGFGVAKELIYFGKTIDAAEALRIGLVNKVVPQQSLEDEARAWALELAKQAPLALRAAKACISASRELPFSESIKFEAKQAGMVTKTEDREEGMKAFLEKRKANFKGC